MIFFRSFDEGEQRSADGAARLIRMEQALTKGAQIRVKLLHPN